MVQGQWYYGIEIYGGMGEAIYGSICGEGDQGIQGGGMSAFLLRNRETIIGFIAVAALIVAIVRV